MLTGDPAQILTAPLQDFASLLETLQSLGKSKSRPQSLDPPLRLSIELFPLLLVNLSGYNNFFEIFKWKLAHLPCSIATIKLQSILPLIQPFMNALNTLKQTATLFRRELLQESSNYCPFDLNTNWLTCLLSPYLLLNFLPCCPRWL